MSTLKDKKIQFAEYAKHFATQISNADNLRDESLQRLHKICVSREKNQQRQLNRLSKKYGENDARVLHQAKSIARQKEIINYMGITIDKTRIDTDSIADSYILRGKLRDIKTRSLAGHTVQLIDAKNNVVGKAVKTDSEGNYSLIVDLKPGHESAKLNIAVLDKQGIQIYLDKRPILLKADVVDTRDIVITKAAVVDRLKENDKAVDDTTKTKNQLARKTKTVKKKADSKITSRKPASKKPK